MGTDSGKYQNDARTYHGHLRRQRQHRGIYRNFSSLLWCAIFYFLDIETFQPFQVKWVAYRDYELESSRVLQSSPWTDDPASLVRLHLAFNH